MQHTLLFESDDRALHDGALAHEPLPLSRSPIPLVVGRVLAVGALAGWTIWLAWRVATMRSAVGAAVFAFELVAFAAAIAMTVGLWRGASLTTGRRRGAPARVRAWFGGGCDERISARRACAAVAATARRLAQRTRPDLAGVDLVRTVLATDGLRRAAFVGAVVVVLLSGRVPFELPPVWAAGSLVAAVVVLAVAHACMSGWSIRPSDRFVWSLATIGAGLGRRESNGVVPVRWTAAMATVVVLNVAVALRGVSDRWTHGLAAMPRDARVVAMAVALTVAAGACASLRSLPRPDVGTFGATGRLDELSARRWALGATGAVAALGVVLGAMPAGVGI
ncbi:MAG: hypothetical protein AAGF73_00245 [Actinomycetota bacterium]